MGVSAGYFGGDHRPPLTPPTRDQICRVKYSFQGMTIQTPTFGTWPWAENLSWFYNAADRQVAYAAKRANGDTHLILGISGAYKEPSLPAPYNDPRLGQDFAYRLPDFVALVAEAVAEGFYVDVRLAGDGLSVNADPGPGQYNDAVGWTYGYQWLMQNFARIFEALKDYNDYIVWCPGFDGVFYGWDDVTMTAAERVAAFGALARSCGAKYVGLEFNTGHIPVGNGPADYEPGGAMQDYDVLYGEFNPSNYREDSTWQVVARLSPNYVRPPDQPSGDDPNPPFYLGQPSPRGPFYFCTMEILTYYWVRWQVSAQDVQNAKAYFAGMGCQTICI